MITLKKISQAELRPLVELSFKDDEDLVCKYHICEQGFEECVEHTLGRINTFKGEEKPSYFKVVFNKIAIGFLVISYKRLYSFGVSIKYRTKLVLTQWWEAVKKKVGREFICSLYSKNTRAIQFLLRQGMKIGEVRNNIVTLIIT